MPLASCNMHPSTSTHLILDSPGCMFVCGLIKCRYLLGQNERMEMGIESESVADDTSNEEAFFDVELE